MPHTDDTVDAATEAVSHQPTLPALELPDYHGRKPAKMKTALTGAGSRVTRPHSIGDRVVLVIEARVKSAGHEDTDDGLEYVEKLKVLDLFELAPEQGSRLISTVRSLYRTGEDAAKGRRPVPGLGEVGYTDGSGVALLPSEVAELRGDPVRAMLSAELSPAVVVYSDGARDLWPDDYPKDAPRPAVGEIYASDGGDVTVDRLLHHETGEEIAANTITGNTITDSPGSGIAVGDTGPELVDVPARAQVIPASSVSFADGRPLSAVPDLPGDDPDDPEDPYAGDLGDGVDGWEDPTPPRPMTADERAEAEATQAIEATLPTSADFALVDCTVEQLRGVAGRLTDLATARRLVKAEEQGRGRGLKPRAGALESLRRRVTELEDVEHQAAMAGTAIDARAEATS